MSVDSHSAVDRRFSVPFILLMLCLLALLVSLAGLYRTSSLTQTRMADLQVSWQAVMDDGVDGAELLATDRLMQGIVRPVPATRAAAGWSLGMAALSLVFIAWLVSVVRATSRMRQIQATQQDRNAQAAVDKLLDEMAPLASGDLAVNATVTEGAVGALADGLNYAVGELRQLVGSQLAASSALTGSTSQSQEFAGNLEQHYAQQSDRLHQSSNLLLCLSNTTGDLSVSAAETSVTSKLLIDKVLAVSEVLQFSAQQVDEARRQSEKSMRLLQSVAAHVKAIEEGNTSVKEVSRRSELLALNTTIRTSSSLRQAGGRDDVSFDDGLLAGEVTALTETLGMATTDMGSLVNASAADTAKALAAVQSTLQRLDNHMGQLRSAESVLEEIRTYAGATNNHALSMAENSAMNAGVVRDLSEHMDLINQITQRSLQSVNEHGDALEELKKLATDMRRGVSDFTLSDNPYTLTENSDETSNARRAADRAAING